MKFAALVIVGILLLAASDPPRARADPPCTDAALNQERQLQDAQGNPILTESGTGNLSAFPFAPGQRNVLVLHGFSETPTDGCASEFIYRVSQLYDGVLVYQYPSGHGIAENAQWLYKVLSVLVMGSDLRFDMVAYSEGGLVARAAKEPNTLVNWMHAFGDRVRNLVTIATPHGGLLQYTSLCSSLVPAIQDMLAGPLGSGFLSVLNNNMPTDLLTTRQGQTQYFAIGGVAGGADDGVVAISSALGSTGVGLRTNAVATLPLWHARSLSKAGMPVSESVFQDIKRWVGGIVTQAACYDISGDWSYDEEGKIKCKLGGRVVRKSASGSGTVTISQVGCQVAWSTQEGAVTRTGRISGTEVASLSDVAGPFAVPLRRGVHLRRNRFSASGTFDCGTITLTGSGKARGTFRGQPLACTGSSTVSLIRALGGDTGNVEASVTRSRRTDARRLGVGRARIVAALGAGTVLIEP